MEMICDWCDKVMLEEFFYPNTRKLTPPFSGPYEILRKCSDVTFEIDKPNFHTKQNSEIVHANRLRFFFPGDSFELSNKPIQSPVNASSNDDSAS